MNLWKRLLRSFTPGAKERRGTMEHIDAESAELMQFVQRVPGVISVDSLKAREHGHYVVADVIIFVNPKITVLQGQEIGRRVKLLLMHRFHHLSDVNVRVEPYDGGFPYNMNIEQSDERSSSLLQ